jgi:hypothetical protein
VEDVAGEVVTAAVAVGTALAGGCLGSSAAASVRSHRRSPFSIATPRLAASSVGNSTIVVPLCHGHTTQDQRFK